MDYKLDDRGSLLRKSNKLFLLYRLQTGPGAHLTSYPVVTGEFFLRVKWPAREADYSSPSGAGLMNGEAIRPSPRTCLMHGA
jgi:hypothetical protein